MLPVFAQREKVGNTTEVENLGEELEKSEKLYHGTDRLAGRRSLQDFHGPCLGYNALNEGFSFARVLDPAGDKKSMRNINLHRWL